MLFRNFSSKRLKGSQSYKLSVKKASIIIYDIAWEKRQIMIL